LARPWDERSATDRAATDEYGKTLYTSAEQSDQQTIDRLGNVAATVGANRAQVALAWMLGEPYVTSPIVGATKMQHLDDAVAALSVKLSPADVTTLEAPYVPHPVLGFS
jgi:aryl-alcohol dehydrogenase-like predicted oxidoreductase